MKTPVLIIEDEAIVSMEIEKYLNSLNFDVIGIANNCKSAYFLAMEYKPQIILVAIKIKGEIDGISTAKKILNELDVSIIYLTTYFDEETVGRAIQTNPSGYLTKPFNKKELYAALKIATYNYEKNKRDLILKKGDLILDKEFSYDTKNSQLIYCSEYIHLTKKEIQLMNLLIKSRKSIVSFYEVENELWPEKESNENTRRALVSRLRSKMKFKFIETIPSIGYRLT